MLAAEELLQSQEVASEGQELNSSKAFTQIDQWTLLVERIRKGDPEALEILYRHFSKGIRFFLFRQLGMQELDDKVHDTFLIVVEAIVNGELREPDRLMGYIRTVVRRQVAAHIDVTSQMRRDGIDTEAEDTVADSRVDPEQSMIRAQQAELMKELLRGISDRDREILTRFYLHEQPIEQICRELGLSKNQFRLLKSRAKARFCKMGRRRFASQLFFKNS